jgi:hypothetical protein
MFFQCKDPVDMLVALYAAAEKSQQDPSAAFLSLLFDYPV